MSLWPELASGEFRLHYVDAGPVRTRTLEAGDGDEAIVFLHGTGGHLETYTRNILPHAEKFRVFAIDMVGHGYSTKPGHDLEMPDYVRHLVDFIDAVGLERVHLSGESLGGWVAVKFAAQYPDRVGKLVLNTCGGLTADQDVIARLRALSMKAVEDPSLDTVRQRLEFLMHDPATVTDDLVEMRHAIYTQPGFVDAMRNLCCLLVMETRTRNMITDDELRALRAPTLIVWTSHDPMGAVEVGERLRDTIAGARLEVMQDCGHWPQFENAELFNRLEIDFLLE